MISLKGRSNKEVDYFWLYSRGKIKYFEVRRSQSETLLSGSSVRGHAQKSSRSLSMVTYDSHQLGPALCENKFNSDQP